MVEVMSCGGTSAEYGKRCRKMVPVKSEVEDWDEPGLKQAQKRLKLDSSQVFVCFSSPLLLFLVFFLFDCWEKYSTRCFCILFSKQKKKSKNGLFGGKIKLRFPCSLRIEIEWKLTSFHFLEMRMIFL